MVGEALLSVREIGGLPVDPPHVKMRKSEREHRKQPRVLVGVASEIWASEATGLSESTSGASRTVLGWDERGCQAKHAGQLEVPPAGTAVTAGEQVSSGSVGRGRSEA